MCFIFQRWVSIKEGISKRVLRAWNWRCESASVPRISALYVKARERERESERERDRERERERERQ